MNSSRWIAGMLVLAGCGGGAAKGTSTTAAAKEPVEAVSGGENPPEVHKRGTDKLIVAVGPAGGTLELDNGARVVIPQGALASGTEVTLAKGKSTTAFSNHEYEHPVGPALEVQMEGAALNSPIELSIPLGQLPEGFGEKDLAVGVEVAASNQRYESAAVQTRWDYLNASSRSGRAVAELTTAPEFRVQFLVSKSN